MPAGSRQQTKRITICAAKAYDGRPGLSGGVFEAVLSQQAKDSGLWSLSLEKGPVTADTPVHVDITLTLPPPRSLGGVVVGSWKSFSLEVMAKGGWSMPGEGDESRTQITLEAYVGL